MERANREGDRGRGKVVSNLADVRAKIAKLVQRIEADDDAPEGACPALEELEAEKRSSRR